jgi:hypothetical protein
MDKQDKRNLAYKLAVEKYGNNAHVALWGSAAVLLSDKDLDIIIKVMEK